MKVYNTLLVIVMIIPLTASPLHARSRIVVNFGPHPSAEAAGHSEARVDWLDNDGTEDTVCTECFAALELQRYLREATGRANDYLIVDDGAGAASEEDILLVGGPASNAATKDMASVLGVDANRLTELGEEGYHIKSTPVDGRRVTLVAGGGRVGTLYGVYDLLYRLGCRWFGPGKVHEEVSRIEHIPDLNVTQRPSFITRGFLAWEDRGNTDFLYWMARNRLNEWCVEQSDHALMHKLGIRMVTGRHDAESLLHNPDSVYPYDHPDFTGDQQHPEDPYPMGDQYQGDANSDGKLSYFEAHPEWFAYVNGRRIPGIRGRVGTNYCTSNPYATTEYIKNFVQALADGQYAEADVVRFWTLDGGKWCQCAECKALGIPTDRNLLLVNRLDKEIKKSRAEGKITRPITIRFLAYADVLDPPTRRLPVDFDYRTCCATFYPIVRCYVHDFNSPLCSHNVHYRRQLDNWAAESQRHYRGQICIGEYYNVSGYKCLPVCFMRTMASDIPYYYNSGARQFQYMHVTTDHWGNKALTNYQLARQLWDADTNCEALWEDYFAKRYGPAAETMRRFYESLEKMFSNVSELKYGLARRLDRGDKNLFPSSHLCYECKAGQKCDGPALVEIVGHAVTARELINRASGMDLPERIKARVAEDEMMFTYGERTIHYFHECVQAFQLGRSGQRDEARRHYVKAGRIAALLRQDTISTAASSEHANSPNAFEATYATGALEHLARLLGPLD